ncbi:MAG: hypothetical protein HOY79_33970 [Streptomyces sp.]|nr:hypothetical protein [Streptomyces sp.]NUS11300.1 hypothetical protein [Streptomyces sp.]NUS23425.1 hypothetical protein [Streptomyces sp.]
MSDEPSVDKTAGQALALALAGVDWHTIADKLKYADPADALQAAMQVAEEQYDGPPADPQRILEVLRLNRLQAALWKDAMDGDAAAVQTVLGISDRRIRTLRLNQRSKD